MKFDFDTVIPRQNTGSAKWDFVVKDGVRVQSDESSTEHGDRQLLPLWVADMDFECPPQVIEAMHTRLDHGIFGYSMPMHGYFNSITDWVSTNYNWEVDRDWIVLSPGVVPVMNMLMMTFAKPGDKVLIQGPVYYHFMRAPTNHGIDYVSSDIVYDADAMSYHIDFDDFERKAADPNVKIAMLCNPHNPSSRVWSREDLERIAEICVRHDLLIVSDEIHCDLVFPGNTFIPMASLSDEVANRTITMMAASKTFNIAGLKTSHTIISNPQLRERFVEAIQKLGLFGGNTMGIIATEAAYTHGREWLDQVLAYVYANYEFTRDYFAQALPKVRVIEPEGTYLQWIDCGPLGFGPDERKERIYENARVWLDDGSMFGESGANFERINLACPRATLATALERMAKGLQN